MIKKENKIFIVSFLIFVFVLFLSLVYGRISYKEIDEPQNIDTIEIDWEKIYPYSQIVETEALPKYKRAEKDGRISNNRIVKILRDFGTIGESWSRDIYKHDEISKVGYIINSRLADASIGESYIKLKNGYWVSASDTEISEEDAINSLSTYYFLKNYLDTKDIPFLYCCTPTKECAIDNQLPNGVTSYANENIDRYIDALKFLNIDYMDLRENLHADGLDHYSLFYKTDHHWTIDAGMWAASKIENELNSRYGTSLRNVDQAGGFTRRTYENAMFGSAGHAVTHFNAQSEKFDIMFPDFENRFSLDIPDKRIKATGSFEDIFIDYEGLNSDMENGGGYAYEKILYGNRPYVKIKNLYNQDGPRILMIRDSFSIAVAPYLAFSCSELVMLDTRISNGNFTGSIVNCIDKEKPDIVIALQNSPQSIIINKKH